VKVRVFDTAAAAEEAAAEVIVQKVRARPGAVLGLATGGTMEPVYRALVAAHRGGLSFAQVTTFNLDEYVGLGPDHPQSYRHYMQNHLFDRIDVDPSRTHVPRGDVPPEEAIAEYEAALARFGPVDLQLLGLGRNGHIGFNEPGSPFSSATRCVSLAESTREANQRFFEAGQPIPEQAVTMGITTILGARQVLLLAVGEAKAEAVRAMIEDPVSEALPASALRGHSNVTACLDRASARLLREFRAEV
jgi:glucosamine-6-phosphate deaminase